ncbi:Chromophore lyase CRL [Abeliophyllum distichum]|uniref:Chromophore lyase CRL n=1 Tax=Abeliophyllum distichum TaxID=126358 RepID=A0ABD1R9A1_9LAMI
MSTGALRRRVCVAFLFGSSNRTGYRSKPSGPTKKRPKLFLRWIFLLIESSNSMCTGSVSGSDSNSGTNEWSRARRVVTLVLIGSALCLKRMTKSTMRWDHTRIITQSLIG